MVRYQEHIAVNASATLNSSKAREVAQLEATASRGQLHPPTLHVKLPICGSQIRRILRTQITVTLPPLWQAAVKGARAAKRNKWRGSAQRGGGRLCRLRVSLRAACQSGTQGAALLRFDQTRGSHLSRPFWCLTLISSVPRCLRLKSTGMN